MRVRVVAFARKPEEGVAADLAACGFPADVGEGGVNLAIPLVFFGDSTPGSNPFLAKFRHQFTSMGM